MQLSCQIKASAKALICCGLAKNYPLPAGGDKGKKIAHGTAPMDPCRRATCEALKKRCSSQFGFIVNVTNSAANVS